VVVGERFDVGTGLACAWIASVEYLIVSLQEVDGLDLMIVQRWNRHISMTVTAAAARLRCMYRR
jgi:hypothetical protein